MKILITRGDFKLKLLLEFHCTLFIFSLHEMPLPSRESNPKEMQKGLCSFSLPA